MTAHDSMTVRVSDDVTLHSETFGDRGDPPILLIMGAMSSGVWWPDRFCVRLSARKRYVVRYDHRDTGGSTSYDPGTIHYTVEDLADDAIAVLDAHELRRVHIAGMSLGGYLAQLMALKYPERVLTMTLISSERLAEVDPTIPGVARQVLDYHAAAANLDWSDREAVIDYQIGAWRLLTGPGRKFDEGAVAAMAAADLDRASNPLSAFNHSMLNDAGRWVGRLDEIKVPTLIIHGTHDPVLPYAHGRALERAIAGSKLMTLEGAGHELNEADWDRIIDAIALHTR